MIIAPSLLNSDICRIPETLDIIEKSGAEYLHIDVMDGTLFRICLLDQVLWQISGKIQNWF